ncbi:Potassium channel subfamily K member 18 [Taenia solium]|eukprot:TsM_000667700 transcript=TsM_000667700 gene=TsM_000667700
MSGPGDETRNWGYGHVTPQTQYGKLLTMLYAVIGIPLFFSYLSKSGDMMASLFRLAYARGCKPVFRMISRRRGRNAAKNGLYNSMQSLALIANLDNTVMRLHHKDSTNSNDSTNLDRNLSINSTKTTHSDGSPSTDVNKNPKIVRSCGKSKGKNPRPLKRSVSTKSFRDLRRNAVAEVGSRKAVENDSMLTIVPGGKLIVPPSSSLDSYNRPYKKFLSSGTDNISTSTTGINNGANNNSMKRKLIIHNVPKPSSEEKPVNVPISLTLCMMFIYILIGATVFCMWENPDYIKWSYFCFVTLSTIGFGDIVPGTKIDSENPKEKMIALVFYVAIGLSFFAMCFKLMQEEAMNKLRRIGQRIGILKRPEEEQAANLIGTTDANPLLPSDGAATIIVTTNTSANTSRSLGHRSVV